MGNPTLGLDLGPNSIGWALIRHDDIGQSKDLVACGVRIFQEAIEAKTRTPKNQARRQARAVRKLLARRKMRRDALLKVLIQQGMLPKEQQERQTLFSNDTEQNPYLLRKRGLDEKLSLHEFGRVLFQINKRRGFKSNRKAQLAEIFKQYRDILELIKRDEAAEVAAAEERQHKKLERALAKGKTPHVNNDSDDEADEGLIKAAISLLRKRMSELNCRTLGEYLYQQPKKRKIHTDRSMYEEEFEALWQVQHEYYPNLLTDELKARLFRIIFHQRPLKTQKFLVGRCRLEPSRKRAAKALLESQRFRILQDMNNLRIKNPITREERTLRNEERQLLLKKLHDQESMTWSKVRKLLGLHEGERFNLEEGGKEKLIGNRTILTMRKALPDVWDSLSEEKQEAMLTDILTIDRKDALIKRAKEYWGLNSEQAYQLAIAELEPGFASLSLKAINKLLPHLEAGLVISDAKDKAGYLRDDQQLKGDEQFLPEPPKIRNPVVQKALFEVRRLTNAIIRKYGKPSLIRVELARDMKLTKKEKERVKKQNKENERANREAAQKLHELGIIQSPDPKMAARNDLLKYRLWKECEAVCPYTGTSISMESLFSADWDIEHIIPYSLCLDDSYMNKTLCDASFNRNVKKNKIPYEIFSGNKEEYEAVLQRLAHMSAMPYGKRRKFEQKEIKTDDFVSRQLNDTRYISLEVKDYLQKIGISVEISKGEATATLRRRWGLDLILSKDGKFEKNREDHRHHAIDAVVIALTSHSLFQKLSRLSATSNVSLSEQGFKLDAPWDGFYDDVYEKTDEIIVSHAPSRKISDALHEDTAYGYCAADKSFIYRKPLDSLTTSEMEKIRDKRVKQLIQARVAQFDGDPKKAFSDPANPLLHVDGRTPIKTVRLAVNFDPVTVHGVKKTDGTAYKFFKYGNNHHVEIIEDVKTGRRKGIFVTTMEAANRARMKKTEIVQRDHGADFRFVMSLAINDMVQIEHGDKKLYYRVQKLCGSNETITFRFHTAASLEESGERLYKNPNTLRCLKISVSPLGEIRPCRD